MKKYFLLLLVAVAVSIGNSFAQISYSHWSIQAKGGLNTMKGASGSNPWNRDYNPEFGGAIEYTLNPTIGIGAEYLYQNNDHNRFDFTSKLHQTTIFASINLSNLLLTYRNGFWRDFNTYMNLGIGLGYGSWKQSTGVTGDIVNLATSYGVNFEYNIAPMLAIGLEPQFRWNTNGGYNAPAYKDQKDFYTLNFNVRYKFECSKKHIRNQDNVEYQLDQIANYQHQQKQEAAANGVVTPTKMQELLLIQKVKNDSIAKDSLQYALAGKNSGAKSSDGFINKEGQNAGNMYSQNPSDGLTGKESSGKYINSEASLANEADLASSKKPVAMKKEVNTDPLLKRYNVVVGSFSSKENATKVSNNLKKEGLEVFVAQNEQGMYRVVTYTANAIGSAVSQVKKLRVRFPDAWVLVVEK